MYEHAGIVFMHDEQRSEPHAVPYKVAGDQVNAQIDALAAF